jgi:hypothetical protein
MVQPMNARQGERCVSAAFGALCAYEAAAVTTRRLPAVSSSCCCTCTPGGW